MPVSGTLARIRKAKLPEVNFDKIAIGAFKPQSPRVNSNTGSNRGNWERENAEFAEINGRIPVAVQNRGGVITGQHSNLKEITLGNIQRKTMLKKLKNRLLALRMAVFKRSKKASPPPIVVMVAPRAIGLDYA